MEALVALGLASNVLQFVDFSFKIYSKTREVISSAHGATQFNLELEQFCLRLEDFNSKLSLNQHPTSLHFEQDALAGHDGDTIRQHVDGVNGIASDCTLVCNELLDVLRHLRHDSLGRLRLPKALVKVIREQFKSKKIAHLEDKLKNFQSPLLLHLTALLNARQIYMTDLLKSVASEHHEHQFSQTRRFDDLKSQLNTMADDIKALTTKLHDQATTRTHITIDGIKDLERLLSGLRLSEKGIGKAAKEQEIIQSLSFPEKTLRHENIAEAHQKTLEWVLQSRSEHLSAGRHDKKPTELSQGGDFLHWLQNDNGIFWITGKPGSGKSTLMKFIAGHNKTRRALESWAGEKEVVIASHYFWAIGTEKQKSERGLLQKMVFDVLSQCPQLAWDIFPARCKQDRTLTAASFSLPHGEAWPLAELRQALLLLSEITSISVKFCFFIDGLDEYSEDLIDLCETVKGFAKSENVKCCVSSRPWNEFKAMFGGEQSAHLRVHELTQNDIRRFAHDRLTGIPSVMDNPVKESLSDLADTVAKRAEGVFLWVFLVTRELRKGMSNGDTIAELSALLESVPSELEEYFKHMMESVPARHHRYMAKTLQIALASDKPLPLDVYYAYENKDVNADFACSMPIDLYSAFPDRDSSDYKACKQRINGRCKGLLSLSKDDNVDFIHRTVYSYLTTHPMQDYLKSKIKATFHPILAILESMMFSVRSKAVDLAYRSLPAVTSRWLSCLPYLEGAMTEDKEATFRLMDKFANVRYPTKPGIAYDLQDHLDLWFIKPCMTLKLTATPDYTASDTVSDTGVNNHDMVKLCSKGTALSSGCRPYVMARLRANRDYFRAEGLSALGVVLQVSAWDPKVYNSMALVTKRLDFDEVCNSVIELLEMGFVPNESIRHPKETKKHTTPWKIFLAWSENRIGDYLRDENYSFYNTALTFLKYGADKSLLVDCHVDLVRRIINDTCVGFPNPKLLQDVLAALFDTPLHTKALLLKRVLEELERFSSERGVEDRPVWAARAAVIEMISIEMINVSLNEKSFTKWLSVWRKFPDSISPRLEAMAEEYLRASLDKYVRR